MLNKLKEQDYGKDPLAVRESDKYQEEYVHAFVDKWDELIDWDGRAKAEGGFFIEKLHERGVKKVLDVATGTGFHSVQLLRAGFEVTSVDGSPVMLAKAFENKQLLPDGGTRVAQNMRLAERFLEQVRAQRKLAMEMRLTTPNGLSQDGSGGI